MYINCYEVWKGRRRTGPRPSETQGALIMWFCFQVRGPLIRAFLFRHESHRSVTYELLAEHKRVHSRKCSEKSQPRKFANKIQGGWSGGGHKETRPRTLIFIGGTHAMVTPTDETQLKQIQVVMKPGRAGSVQAICLQKTRCTFSVFLFHVCGPLVRAYLLRHELHQSVT